MGINKLDGAGLTGIDRKTTYRILIFLLDLNIRATRWKVWWWTTVIHVITTSEVSSSSEVVVLESS